MANLGFWATVRREIRRISSRKMYFAGMILVPIAMLFFFVSLLGPGLPLKVPAAIVDLDHSSMSRQVTRSLQATELIDISSHCESYDKAMAAVRRGDVFGFFVIPADFEKDVVAGRKPTLEFYNNLTYFVPGTLTFKGFKTVAVTTSGGVVKTLLTAAGVSDEQAMALIQPMTFDSHPIGNPWLSYAIYLAPTFLICLLALMMYLMTTFAITMEIKTGTSVAWLETAHGHISVAVLGKLLPHFVIWSIVGQFVISILFCYNHFPHGSLWILCLGMELFVLASMSFGVFISCVVPNPRLSFTLCALIGILSFSFAGLSFPVQQMYGAIAIFSYIVPSRYMILIYFFAGLNSFPIYYSRLYLAALIVFPLVASMLLLRLKRACLKPVYVP